MSLYIFHTNLRIRESLSLERSMYDISKQFCKFVILINVTFNIDWSNSNRLIQSYEYMYIFIDINRIEQHDHLTKSCGSINESMVQPINQWHSNLTELISDQVFKTPLYSIIW